MGEVLTEEKARDQVSYLKEEMVKLASMFEDTQDRMNKTWKKVFKGMSRVDQARVCAEKLINHFEQHVGRQSFAASNQGKVDERDLPDFISFCENREANYTTVHKLLSDHLGELKNAMKGMSETFSAMITQTNQADEIVNGLLRGEQAEAYRTGGLQAFSSLERITLELTELAHIDNAKAGSSGGTMDEYMGGSSSSSSSSSRRSTRNSLSASSSSNQKSPVNLLDDDEDDHFDRRNSCPSSSFGGAGKNRPKARAAKDAQTIDGSSSDDFVDDPSMTRRNRNSMGGKSKVPVSKSSSSSSSSSSLTTFENSPYYKEQQRQLEAATAARTAQRNVDRNETLGVLDALQGEAHAANGGCELGASNPSKNMRNLTKKMSNYSGDEDEDEDEDDNNAPTTAAAAAPPKAKGRANKRKRKEDEEDEEGEDEGDEEWHGTDEGGGADDSDEAELEFSQDQNKDNRTSTKGGGAKREKLTSKNNKKRRLDEQASTGVVDLS